MMATMQVISVNAPHDVQFIEKEIKQPGPGEVLVKVMSAGICGTDADIISGDLIYFKNGMASMPIVPGHEWSGQIVECGPGVRNFATGDRVTGECTVACGHCKYCVEGYTNMCINRTETGVMNRDGGYAGYITFPVTSLHQCNGLEYDTGACVEPTCIAMSAIKRSGITPRDNVLVIGPGPIGLMAAQIVKKIYHANKVILSGTRDDRLARASGYGLDGIVNVRRENLQEKVRDSTRGEMIDVVIEAAGAPSSFTDMEKVLNPAGRISLLSFFGSKEVKCNWDFISTNSITVYGSLGSPGVWPFVIAKLESCDIEVDSIISHRLPLKSREDFLDAFYLMEERRDNVCKVILHP